MARWKTSLPFLVPVVDVVRCAVLVVVTDEARGFDVAGAMVDARLLTVRADVVGFFSATGLRGLGTVERRCVAVDALGLTVLSLTLLALFRVVVSEELAATGGLPSMRLSRARLEAVCLTTAGGPSLILGAGRALKARLFSISSDSFFRRSSLAAFNLAATASPGSWKEDFVGALLDFGGAGGVGNEREIGRGFECGISVCVFSLVVAGFETVLALASGLFVESVRFRGAVLAGSACSHSAGAAVLTEGSALVVECLTLTEVLLVAGSAFGVTPLTRTEVGLVGSE